MLHFLNKFQSQNQCTSIHVSMRNVYLDFYFSILSFIFYSNWLWIKILKWFNAISILHMGGCSNLITYLGVGWRRTKKKVSAIEWYSDVMADKYYLPSHDQTTVLGQPQQMNLIRSIGGNPHVKQFHNFPNLRNIEWHKHKNRKPFVEDA